METPGINIEKLASYIVENRENKEVIEEFLEMMVDHMKERIKQAYTQGWYEGMLREYMAQEELKL